MKQSISLQQQRRNSKYVNSELFFVMITKNTKFILLHLYFCLSTPFLLSVLGLENVFLKKLKIFSSQILNNSLFDVNNWFLLSNYNIFIVTFCIIFIIFHINFMSIFCICVHYIISKNQCLQKMRQYFRQARKCSQNIYTLIHFMRMFPYPNVQMAILNQSG